MAIDTQKLREALSQIEDALNDAYQSAGQECCGHGYGECCGNPEPVWDAADQKIMDVLGPIQRMLSDAAPQVDAQAAEITRLKAAQVWQPIETAPKDRRILLMRDGNRICIGRYCPDRGALNVLPEYWTDEGYGVTWARNHPPTHWMPLPDAPVALQETRQ